MAFTISSDSFSAFKESLNPEILDKAIVKAVGSVVGNLHNVLDTQVQETYATGGRGLTSVLVGRTASAYKRGLGFIEFGLTYESKRLPLSAFYLKSLPTSAETSFIAPNIFTPNLQGKIKRKKPVLATTARILKKKDTLIKGAFQGKVNGKVRVLRRGNYFTGGRTWKQLPTKDNLEGIREPYYEVNGPSLSEMAAKVYESNPYLLKFRDNFADRVSAKLEIFK